MAGAQLRYCEDMNKGRFESFTATGEHRMRDRPKVGRIVYIPAASTPT
jgi:hypothetical protein